MDATKPKQLSAIVIFLIILATLPNQGEGACSDIGNLGVLANISETMRGVVLFNVTKNPTDQIEFNIKNAGSLSGATLTRFSETFFLPIIEDTYFTLRLKPNTSLDLELIYSDFGSEVTDIILSIKCAGGTYEPNIRIGQVNEFKPVFSYSPYTTSIIESLAVNSTVFDFTSRVIDADIPSPLTFYYALHQYLIEDLDGRDYFELKAVTKGVITVRRPLDFDNIQRHYWKLNVSVQDGNQPGFQQAFTTLNITVTDADDQNPYFDIPGCQRPCIAPPYEAIISPSYKGSITVFPVAIKAKDNDTLGTPLQYTIDGQNYGMFQIDMNSGEVTQTMSVYEANRNDSVFRMIIKVKKQSKPDLSALAILSVKVAGRQPNVTIPIAPEGTQEDSKSSDLLIPVIILGILLVLLIFAIIVVVVLMRKKQKQLLVSPEQDEPQTEEEEIGTDRSDEYNTIGDHNEKLVFGGKVTRAISTDMYPTPSQKANTLPPLPLRDSATETTEGRKKRSRKRKKNKEPEIFDGTKEYNMGIHPEFFESTDKSRIKRSQRSKKADSTQPINVPNDNPVEGQEQVMHM